MIVMVTMALFPALFAGGADPTDCDLSMSRQAPSAAHWFGIDLQGCDYYANVVYGARTSVAIGCSPSSGCSSSGCWSGAGCFGGWIDPAGPRHRRVLRHSLFWGADPADRLRAPIGVDGVAGAGRVRLDDGDETGAFSSVVAIRGSDYVLAAQALGAPTGRILVRHILPNALAPVLIYATIAVGTFISAEAALTISVSACRPGDLLGSADQRRAVTDRHLPHLLFFPRCSCPSRCWGSSCSATPA